MFCKVNWTRKIAHTALPKTHHPMLADRRALNLLSRERSLLPHTQQVLQMKAIEDRAVAELNMMAEKEVIIRTIRDRIKRRDLTVLAASLDEALAGVPSVEERLAKMKSERMEKCKKRPREKRTLEAPASTSAASIDIDATEHAAATEIKAPEPEHVVATEPLVAVGQCPREECRGFLQATSLSAPEHVCGMCSYSACGKCHKVLTPEHECLSEDLACVRKPTTH